MMRSGSRKRSRWFRFLLIGGLGCAGIVLAWWLADDKDQGNGSLQATLVRVDTDDRPECDISVFLAGDAIITQPWSHITVPTFLRLVDEIRAADVAVTNLETVIHEFRGYAQAQAGGVYMTSPPLIASELTWAGIDMVGHANDHTFDYGAIGVLENLDNVSRVGLVLAGSGRDLQEARAPRYMQVGDKTVALISAASSFVSFGKASRSRPDLHGRPGLNPLATTSEPVITITPRTAERLGQLARLVGRSGKRFEQRSFNKFGFKFRVGEAHGIEIGERVLENDLKGNLAAIRTGAETADIVVMSLHAHHDMPDWLSAFARRAIDEGADVILVHGPHYMLGVELYNGRPIFYGMGSFVFQNEQIERLPSEFYEAVGLGDDATPAEALSLRPAARYYQSHRRAWESFASALCLVDDRIVEIRLIPLDLGFRQPLPERGRPRYADERLGRSIMDQVQQHSADFGTTILFSPEMNAGFIQLNPD